MGEERTDRVRRRCSPRLGRGGPRWSPLTVHHHSDGGLALTVSRRPPEPPRWGRGIPAGLSIGAAVLVVTVFVLLVGVRTRSSTLGADPCPGRLSEVVYDGDRALRIRAEPPLGRTILVHLCAATAVRGWRTTAGRSKVAVQAVGARWAIAAVPMGPDVETMRFTATLDLGAGVTARFSTLLP